MKFVVVQPDPALLRTFVATVESGSFTAAAARVHRTQSAVSMQIRKLEEMVGCPLFERTTRKVALTSIGEAFYDRARDILRAYGDIDRIFDTRSTDAEIALGLPDDLADTYLAKILQRCLERFPHLHVKVSCEPSKRLLSRIGDGSLDLAVVLEGEGRASGIVLKRESPVWACLRSSEVHSHPVVPLAIFHSGDIFRRHAMTQLERMGRRGRIVISSPSFAGIKAAVRSQAAVAVLFERNVEQNWRILDAKAGFPALGEIETLLIEGTTASGVAPAITDIICQVWSDADASARL